MVSPKDPEHPATADIADRYHLYQLAVQNPRTEIDFVDRTFRQLRGRSGRMLREDFCGTAAVSCEWVGRRKRNRACGVDLDPDVLGWGRRHNLSSLDAAAQGRVALIERDVREVETPSPDVAPDIVLAMNCSYWLLRDRCHLLNYFKRVRDALALGGIFFLDAFGGYDTFRLLTEERRVEDPQGGGFTYIWEQALYEPVTGRLVCHIHFRFDDGSEWPRAFSYDWRLWTLPEIRELLAAAGFSRVMVYWQGWDPDGKPDGVFVPVESGEPDAGWIAYLTAEK